MAGAIGLVLTLLWLAKHPESVPSGRIASCGGARALRD